MSASPALPRLLVTGGAGYVGSVLVPTLLARGHRVRVLDLYLYGSESLAGVRGHPGLEEAQADLRDEAALRAALRDIDAVIHLACISNDPSCELDPALTRSINLDAFEPLVRLAREAGVRRFVFASSSSVYGISEAPQVTEDHPQRPITLYNRYKGECEAILARYHGSGMVAVSLRPATVCGRSPRQRLDLTVNILTAHAVERGVITVFGGSQMRPNLHMSDMVRAYECVLDAPDSAIDGEAFNVSHANLRVDEIAETVRRIVEREYPERGPIRIETTSSDDPRSYHVDTGKIRRRLGFVPQTGIDEAVRSLTTALRRGELPAALEDSRYYNVRRMKELGLR